MPVCPSCGQPLPEGATACPNCASAVAVADDDAPAEETFRCGRCETEYAGADACPACGALRVAAHCAEHPERPAHARCVICGAAVCDRCRPADRTPALCADHASVPVIEGWSQVYSTADELEARLLADNLRAEGIDAQSYSQADHVFPVDLGDLAISRVLVPVWEHGAALDVIRSYMDTRGEVVFACPSCGEVYEPGAETCTACGATLGE